MSSPPNPSRIEDLLAHADWLRCLAGHLVGGADGAEDAIQQTWMAALRSPPDADRPAQPWLAAVLRNFVRRRVRTDGVRRSYEEAAARDPGSVASPEVLLERAEAQRILAGLVAALPDPYRSTVLLRYYEGLTAAAIAAAQGVPAGTVRWRLKEALERLRTGLDARHGGERRAWALVLLPLARPQVRNLPLQGALKGALLMTAKTKGAALAALVVVVVLLGGAFVLRDTWGPSSRPEISGQAAGARSPRAPLARSAQVLQAWARAQGGQPGAIAGVVSDGDGRPRAGALVAMIVAAAYEEIEDKTALRPRSTTTSGPGGAFRFVEVPPGVYLLTATAQGWSPAERTGVSLLPGESIDGLELRLVRGGARLEGRVSDAGGGPVPGAAVRALALGAGGRPDGARTFLATAQTDGRYQLQLPRGSYRVVADADGYAPQTSSVLLDRDQSRDFRLAPAARVTGQVIERGRGPVAGAVVRLDAEGFLATDKRSGTSATSGDFAFTNVPAGSYRLSARADGLIGRAARKVVLAPGGSASGLVIELERGRAVSGKIQDAGGRAVAARVRVDGDVAAALSDSHGLYRIEGLQPGRYSLVAEAAGYGPARAPLVVENTDRDGVNLVLAIEARVRGRVLGRQGEPLPGASVTALVVLDDAASESVTSAAVGRSDAQGRFELGGLGGGDVRVEVEHPVEGRGLAGPVPLAAGATREIDVRVGGGGMLRGTVRWEDGRLAEGQIVHGSVRGKSSLVTTTDAGGRYELGPFSPGAIGVHAYPEKNALGEGGRGPHSTSVRLGPGEDKDGVDLVLARVDGEVSGIVLAPDGSPLDGATVGVAADHNGVSFRPFNKYAGAWDAPNYTVLSAPDGAFVIKSLPKGVFTVWATHPDHPEADAYGVATGSRDVRVRFAPGATFAGHAAAADGKPVTTYTLQAMLSHRNDASPQLKAARGYVQQTEMVQDARGAFEVSGLHAAIYDLLVTTPDGRGGRLNGIVLGPGEVKRGLRVPVGATVRVKGRVVDAVTGQGLGGVNVVGWMAMLITDVRGRTDATGSFVLEGVVPGGPIEINLRGDRRTHQPKFQRVPVPAGVAEIDAGTLTLAPAK